MEKITSISGTALYVAGDDIDTDRIIPARFMKCVTFDGLGEYLFYDVRKNPEGEETVHPLNMEKYRGAQFLISGQNFGCGSSREHAPQAIYRYGFRAIIAQSFAEIFYGNCTTLGIPAVSMSAEDILDLAKSVEAEPTLHLHLDLETRTLTYGEKTSAIDIPEANREALVTGTWDAIDDLLSGVGHVDTTAGNLGYLR